MRQSTTGTGCETEQTIFNRSGREGRGSVECLERASDILRSKDGESGGAGISQGRGREKSENIFFDVFGLNCCRYPYMLC